MMSVARGLANMITDGSQIVGFPDWFTDLSIIRHFGFLSVTVGLMIVLAVDLRRSSSDYRTTGRNLYAIGGSAEVARLSGIPVAPSDQLASTRSAAMLAGLAGIVLAARLDSVQPSSGLGYELDTIAAVVIGGASLSRRRRLDRRHGGRRPHHRRAAQRPQPARRLALHPAGGHRRGHRAGGRHRHLATPHAMKIARPCMVQDRAGTRSGSHTGNPGRRRRRRLDYSTEETTC